MFLKHIFLMGLIFAWIFVGWPRIWQEPPIPPEITPARAATESKWASSHITGTAASPTNALGVTDGAWTSNTSNDSWTSRWAQENPSGAITGTQTINIVARKDSTGGNGDPSFVANLYENGSLVQEVIAATTVTDAGVTGTGTFDASAITDPNLVEIEVVVSAVGGSPAGRRTVQIDSIEWVVNLAVTDQITVGTSGSQVSSITFPTTDKYIGGAFTFVRTNGTADVTSITLSETGTVVADTELTNVELVYETTDTCSYDGDGVTHGAGETSFGSIAGDSFNASEDATVTGTMTVGTSQVCVYVIMDFSSGITDGQTLDIEITNPDTEVVVSAGTVAAGTAAIPGSTTLNLAPATYKAAEDTNISNVNKNENIRLRIEVANVGGTASSYQYRLESASKVGASCGDDESFAAVPVTATTEHFEMTASTFFADSDPTTAQLANTESYTFVAGNMVEDPSNQSGAITLNQNQYTEIEFNFGH